MYITYRYPEEQPKILVQTNPGTQIRPDGMYLSPLGVMAPFPGWTSNSNFSVVVQKLQNHFSQFPPLMPKQKYQPPTQLPT